MEGLDEVDILLDSRLKFFENIDKMIQEQNNTTLQSQDFNSSNKFNKNTRLNSSNNYNFYSPCTNFSTNNTGNYSNKGKFNNISKVKSISNIHNVPSNFVSPQNTTVVSNSNFHDTNFTNNRMDKANNSNSFSVKMNKSLNSSTIKSTKQKPFNRNSIDKKNKSIIMPIKRKDSSKNENDSQKELLNGTVNIQNKNKEDKVFLKLYEQGMEKRQHYEKELENFNNSLLFSHHPEITELAKNLNLSPKDVGERLYPANKIIIKKKQIKKKKTCSLNRSLNKSNFSNQSNKSSSILQSSHAGKLAMSLTKREFYKKFKADSKVKGSIEEIFQPILSKKSLMIAAKKGSSFERLTGKLKQKQSKTTRNSFNVSKISVSNISLVSQKSLFSFKSNRSNSLGHKLYDRAFYYKKKKTAQIIKRQQTLDSEYLQYSYVPRFSVAHIKSKQINRHKSSTPFYDRQSIWDKGRVARLEKFRNHIIDKENESFNYFQPRINQLDICDDEEFIKRNLKHIYSYVERKQKSNSKKLEKEKLIEKKFELGKNYIPKVTEVKEFNLSKKYEKKNTKNQEDLQRSREFLKTNDFFQDDFDLYQNNSVFDDHEEFFSKESFFSKCKNEYQRNLTKPSINTEIEKNIPSSPHIKIQDDSMINNPEKLSIFSNSNSKLIPNNQKEAFKPKRKKKEYFVDKGYGKSCFCKNHMLANKQNQVNYCYEEEVSSASNKNFFGNGDVIPPQDYNNIYQFEFETNNNPVLNKTSLSSRSENTVNDSMNKQNLNYMREKFYCL